MFLVKILCVTFCLWMSVSGAAASQSSYSQHHIKNAGSASTKTRVLAAVAAPEGSEWVIINPVGGQRTVLGQASKDIELLVIDDIMGEFYFRDGGFLMKDSWRDLNRATELIGPLPFSPYALWLDRNQHSLVAIEMHEPTLEEAAGMHANPPDARPMWAYLWRFSTGAWVLAEKRQTSWGADGSVGPSILDDKRHEQGRSARTVLTNSSCAELCDNLPQASLIARLNMIDDSVVPEEWRLLEKGRHSIAFGVALGDTWHPIGPVVIVKKWHKLTCVSKKQKPQLGLQIYKDWLLLYPDDFPSQACLIDLMSGSQHDLPVVWTLPVWVD